MSSREDFVGEDLVVVLDAPELGPARPVGVLTRWPGQTLAVGFAYAASWLRAGPGAGAFAIDPTLPLVEGITSLPGQRPPGIFADTAPGAWGQVLLARREGPDLDGWGLLVGVADEVRVGALRLRRGVDGPFVSARDPAVPPVSALRTLQAAARRFEEDPDAHASDPAIARLIAPGSSLGGARPKTTYRAPDGSLWIAKFPAWTDGIDVGAWEHVYAQLARAAGLDVPDTDLLPIAGSARTFAARRFDRTPAGRRLYASALTLTGRATADDADYADIARAVANSVAAASVRDDLAQLYRRMAFNVLAGNRDDHLGNHGFLRTRAGWRLAPAFGMKPAREPGKHATTVNGRALAPSAADVLAARVHFGLPEGAARSIITEVAAALTGWPELARRAGIAQTEQEGVGAAFSALATVPGLEAGRGG